MIHVVLSPQTPVRMPGAGNGTRTRDIKLGKLALYQLSYARRVGSNRDFNLAEGPGAVKGIGPCPTRRVVAPPRRIAILTEVMARDGEDGGGQSTLYFFPDEEIGADAVREILAGDDQDRRAWVVSHLLRYAQWDDIWEFVSRDEVRELFSELDLPDNLRAAWARMLKIEAPVV